MLQFQLRTQERKNLHRQSRTLLHRAILSKQNARDSEYRAGDAPVKRLQGALRTVYMN